MWLSDMFLFRTLLALTLTDWLRGFTMASCRIPEVRTSTEKLLEAKCIKKCHGFQRDVLQFTIHDIAAQRDKVSTTFTLVVCVCTCSVFL